MLGGWTSHSSGSGLGFHYGHIGSPPKPGVWGQRSYAQCVRTSFSLLPAPPSLSPSAALSRGAGVNSPCSAAIQPH